MKLIVTYRNDEPMRRQFELQIDGRKVADQKVDCASPQEQTGFFDVEYEIPSDLIQGKQKVSVRFQAADGEVASIFGLRVVRADASR